MNNNVNIPLQKEQENSQFSKNNPQEELAKIAREKRKFTILQRERAMDNAQKAKNRSAIMAGICILGAAASIQFNIQMSGQDAYQLTQQVIQHELNAMYSWEALVQYFKDLGPLTTYLTACTSGFGFQYLKNSRKYKQLQNEFIDFNNSLEQEQTLGGNENAKSR